MDFQKVNHFSLKEAMKYSIFMLKWNGLWPPKEEFKYLDSIPYAIFAFIMLILIYTVDMACAIINLVFIYTNLELLASGIYMLSCKINCAGKSIFLVKNFSAMRTLMKDANLEVLQPKNPRQLQIMRGWFDVWRIIFIGVTVGVIIECILISSSPLFDKSNVDKLIFVSWYPYNYRESLTLYLFTFAHQVASYAMLAAVNVNFDMLIIGMMCYISAQCEILADSLKKLHVGNVEDVSEEDVNNQLESRPSYRLRSNLIKCIHHHQTILSYSVEVQKIFNVAVVNQLTCSLACIAMTMFLVTTIDPHSIQFCGSSLYLFGMILELYLLCFFGDEVIQRSSILADAAYESDWYQYTCDQQRDLLFTMLRMQKTIKFYGLNFFELSIPTFTWILRLSISYFGILRQLNDGDDD